jgi:rhomboid protease GluP
MSFRQRTGSMLCPGCGQLVGVNDEACYHCGRKRPGLFGLATALGGLKLEDLFVPLVMWACGALYLATLVSGGIASGGNGLMSILSPTRESLLLFGGSGWEPVFVRGRWWTPLSAGWLHGGILHIAFNMMAVRDLGPLTAQLYGASRTVIVYTLASVAGFATSTLAGLVFAGTMFQGGRLTIGASAAIFGLLGAILYYGRRGGSAMIGEAAKRWILSGLVFGFLMPGIDNWAHLGGLAGGYLLGVWLDPLHPERGDHLGIAILCLVLSAAAVIASVVTGRGYFA